VHGCKTIAFVGGKNLCRVFSNRRGSGAEGRIATIDRQARQQASGRLCAPSDLGDALRLRGFLGWEFQDLVIFPDNRRGDARSGSYFDTAGMQHD